MFAPGGRSLGVTVIFVLTASSTACISSHCFVVVPVTAEVADPGAVESAEGVDGLPLPKVGVLPVPDETVDAMPDAACVDPVPDTTAVVPVPDAELV